MELALLHNITNLPGASNQAEVSLHFEQFHASAKQSDETWAAFASALEQNPQGKALLFAIFGNSPFLSKLVIQQLSFFQTLCVSGADNALVALYQFMNQQANGFLEEAELMKHLRVAKARLSLLVAVADIAGIWELEKVTGTLSEFAEKSLNLVVDHLLRQAGNKQEIVLKNPLQPGVNSGMIVLGMGKLGAGELNYSSDIDLIILFDREKIEYTGKHHLQHYCNRFATDIVRIMQDRTADGYVFRTDLRLRPDPASTPPAISINGAITYYETVGQNWERAALIKARPVAGDYEAAYAFLKDIAPFIWRKSLDFAAIADIHSLKRQMDIKTGNSIDLPGHNIKIGIGGIREIEFFAQIHQLIWGGRQMTLRTLPTCVTLRGLVQEGLVAAETAEKLIEAYHFYRQVEHRLQMIQDNQTHSLPQTEEGIAHVATFMGFATTEDFKRQLEQYLLTVHDIYSESFQGSESLGNEGILVFTGVENDPATLKTIEKLGFANPGTVSEVIRGWHHGNRRATRTKRARELITELTPALLRALGSTANPDAAFLKFDEFLLKLPAGVQLFALFTANPQLLELLIKIMGSAPSIAEDLSKNPSLLEAALIPEFFTYLPTRDELLKEFSLIILYAKDYEEEKYILRRFKSEKMFQVGVQLLDSKISSTQASNFLSDLAEIILQRTQVHVEHEFAQSYGIIPDGSLAVIGMGKLGARELTFGSDLDLIFVYDAPSDEVHSDGERGYAANIYYNRLVPRFINALTVLTKDGRLYEVDTRLRPSGKDGPIAVNASAFEKYFTTSAWTFEFMAMVRARAVTGNEKLREKLSYIIHHVLTQKRDLAVLAKDLMDMRQKVVEQFGTTNPWHVKYIRGGIMDLDFLCQFLALRYAHDHPGVLQPSNSGILQAVQKHGLLLDTTINPLLEASDFLSRMLTLLRLCNNGVLDESQAPAGLKKLLTESFQMPDFESLKARLLEIEALVYTQFNALIKA